MPSQNIFQWKDGRGWLVFSGGNDATGAVRATAIERASADGGLAVLVMGDAVAADDALQDMQELGAPAGYLVDVLTEDDDTIRQRIGEAGIVLLSSDSPPNELRSGLLGAAIEGVETAYERGAIIALEDQAAAVFSTYFLAGEAVGAGFEWLQHIAVVPGMTSAAESPIAQAITAQQPEAVVVGIGEGAALALGGDGTVETWGNKAITIALGSAYTDE